MRDYLKRGYGVDVLAVRSYIEQKPITRITRDGRNLGAWRRPKSEKRMTVELKEAFIWPAEPKDLSPYVSLNISYSGPAPTSARTRGSFWTNTRKMTLEAEPVLIVSFSIGGRSNPGTLLPSTKKKHRSKPARKETHRRSPITTCERHTRSRLRRSRRSRLNGDLHGRLWA